MGKKLKFVTIGTMTAEIPPIQHPHLLIEVININLSNCILMTKGITSIFLWAGPL